MKFLKLVCLITLILSCTITAISPEIYLSSTTIKQGNTLKVTLKNKELIPKSIALFDTYFPLYKQSENTYIAYIGIPNIQPTGTYTLTIAYPTPNTFQNLTHAITVTDAQFQRTTISLPPQKRTLAKKRTQLSDEAQLIRSHFATVTSLKFSDGPFISPTEGVVSSPFGAYRVYTGVGASSRHQGIDIANKKGTPVIAPNHGHVRLATAFESHGNTLIIDHGIGILTIYNHLDQLLVQAGDWVQKGQVIGTIGDTGITTAPHLHWGMSIHNTRVSPTQWIEDSTLTSP
jgi:murein DD-endopeptidase MepM/ murein hydrolase activator NlpD